LHLPVCFFSRAYSRLLRPGLAAAVPALHSTSTALKRAFDKLNDEIDACIQQAAFARRFGGNALCVEVSTVR
jgi:hypothetical protein